MKKLILTLLCTLVLTTAFAELNENQLALRRSISSFLRDEGYSPTIDDDGDIRFKYEGDSYYVLVSSSDTNPMYIAFVKYFSCSAERGRFLAQNAREFNLYKGIKFIVNKDYEGYNIRSEMYLINADPFKYSFYKILRQINNCEKEVIETAI
ncbi:MAG: hypothetical protein IJ838_05550 [Paludibacteraceae bacterium]|nr:hypothetical protein [Paludibacteraceae bacterium]